MRLFGGDVANFNALMKNAEAHHGAEAIKAVLASLETDPKGVTLADDRILAQMTKGIFCAGFSWKVVENKWVGFEEAFQQFDIGRNALMSDEDFDRLVSDVNIIRNGQKIRSVQHNAQFIVELRKEHGSAAAYFSNWPEDDFVGLLKELKKRGNRLGGGTGQYFLRMIGVPSLVASKDVVSALISQGIVDKAPTAQRDWAAVQQGCNILREQSGLNLSQISKLMALSVG